MALVPIYFYRRSLRVEWEILRTGVERMEGWDSRAGVEWRTDCEWEKSGRSSA